MAIYVDSRSWVWQGQQWGHLIGDSLAELHGFAATLGLQPVWFQGSAKFPHYDLTLKMRANAVAAGAIQLTSRNFIEKAQVIANRKDGELIQLPLDF